MHALRFGIAAAAACLISATPSLTQAQGVPMPKELGIDAGIQFGLGDDSYTSVDLPAQRFRVGFFRSPTVSIEPYGAYHYDDPAGRGGSSSVLSLGTGLLYHLQPDRADNQIYVRPFAELNYISAGESDTQFGIGAGLGLKMPWRDRLSSRFEAALGYAFESDHLKGGATLNLTAGLSFFTAP